MQLEIVTLENLVLRGTGRKDQKAVDLISRIQSVPLESSYGLMVRLCKELEKAA